MTLHYIVTYNINSVCLVLPFCASAARMYRCDIICWDMAFSPPCPILKSVRHTLKKGVGVVYMARDKNFNSSVQLLLNLHKCLFPRSSQVARLRSQMVWHLCIVSIALTTHQLQVERRESHRANQVYTLTTHQLQVERRESHRVNQVYALTTHQLQVERRESHGANQVYALTTHQLQVERRESHGANQVYALTTHQLQVERRESHRANQVYALTTHQLQVERRESHRANQVYALTTHQLQVERRESHRDNQVYGDY